MGVGAERAKQLFVPEISHIFRPEVIILPTPAEVDQFAANTFIEQVQLNPNSVLTLPTGSTPVRMYEIIRQTYKEQGLDLSGLTVNNLDEYWPLPATSPSSYASFMAENLFNHVNVPPNQHHIPNSDASDPHEEAARYESVLAQQPTDLAIVGIGPGTTCHIGFNGPSSAHDSRTRYVQLDDQTLNANAQYCDGNSPPPGAITQGIGNILEAERILLIAKGAGKAWGIQRTLEGPVNSDSPASFLRLHPRVTFILDNAAAQMLSTH